MIVYGKEGRNYYYSMMQTDTAPMYNTKDINKIIAYVITKSNKNLYNNPGWDLVDAMEKNSGIIDTLDMNTLDDSLKTKSRTALKKIVENNSAERKRIRERITDLSAKQEKYIREEKEKRKVTDPQTLETEIEKIIREQVKRVNMKIQ